MRRFGIDVGRFEKSGALREINLGIGTLSGGKFDVSETIELWKKLHDESVARGSKGSRVTAELACFFENRAAKDLVEYERSLHRVFEVPMTAICAYDTNVVANEEKGELYLNLIKVHSTVIIIGPEGGVVKSH